MCILLTKIHVHVPHPNPSIYAVMSHFLTPKPTITKINKAHLNIFQPVRTINIIYSRCRSSGMPHAFNSLLKTPKTIQIRNLQFLRHLSSSKLDNLQSLKLKTQQQISNKKILQHKILSLTLPNPKS